MHAKRLDISVKRTQLAPESNFTVKELNIQQVSQSKTTILLYEWLHKQIPPKMYEPLFTKTPQKCEHRDMRQLGPLKF